MHKTDKLIAIIAGLVVLGSSISVYIWKLPEPAKQQEIFIEETESWN